MKLKQGWKITYGADPEAFFSRGGTVIGSEKVIPGEGLGGKTLIQDGVAFEFNPRASTTPKGVGKNLSAAFKTLEKRLGEVDGVEALFVPLVDVEAGELASLSEESRRFGCAPSLNIYRAKPIGIDGATYLKRSGAGHPHFGLSEPIFVPKKGIDERTRLVPLFDIIVGNTCVLLDREPGQEERRKYYGRAGEFRLPKHGIEYRTPSNFWLYGYPLFSLVAGLGKGAIDVLSESILADAGEKGALQLEDELVERVSIKKVVKAINENDVNLAWANWKALRPFLEAHPIDLFPTKASLDTFEKFASRVQEKGLRHFFPKNPIEMWGSGEFVEFTDFVDGIAGI